MQGAPRREGVTSYWTILTQFSSSKEPAALWLPILCDTLAWGSATVALNLGGKTDSVAGLFTLQQLQVLSVTSLIYCTRMSLNFIIICRLMASRDRMCLNFRSMSNAASADRSVLKDSSIKFFASFSITCQNKTTKKSRKHPSCHRNCPAEAKWQKKEKRQKEISALRRLHGASAEAGGQQGRRMARGFLPSLSQHTTTEETFLNINLSDKDLGEGTAAGDLLEAENVTTGENFA